MQFCFILWIHQAMTVTYIDEGDEWNLPILTDVIPQLNHELPITPQLQQIYTKKVVTDIENNTQGQIKNEEWFLHRRGRITASPFSSLLHFRFTDKSDNHNLRQIMGNNSY